MNEKQILRAIVTTISPIADDYLWQYRDEDGKEMSYSASLVRLVEYANVHHKFWELVEGGLFDTRELVKLCKAGPTMEDAFRLGAKGLRWKELVDA